ncbi:tripartite tricarboxylate transporter permease [Desulfopila inferna]|uniref:tripartite tricarboxylate transporter permease n=1 Tax=Desulfopila inferna TaxID=468528 RepID=UPI0019646417|nr:tripartite tricarboxylate transporter permease [Desulfopila inferna]MBM9603896.1 tripartite tricarboxylate transporter permease [Desulfopila inferna]
MLLETFIMLLDPVILLSIFAGVSAGLFVGAMPGLTATMALAVLLPFTFTLPPLHGLVALGAVYMGAIYGGSFAAILVNTPGTPSSIATAFEGYPMAKQGRAIEALNIATIASAVGGIAGSLFLLLLSPPLAKLSLRFGPAEYFWVAILGLTLIASLSEGSSIKGMMGGALGMIIGTIGVAPIGGETRFTFGMPVLQGGVAMIVALIGLFVLPELYTMAAKGKTSLKAIEIDSKARSSFWQVTKTVFSMPGNLIRSCIIGEIIAIIPGAGGNVANLVAYNEAKRASKHPEKFGTGLPEGLVASESSNNVTVAGSMVPLLTLGIPGAPPDAVILGVMMLHGLRPGIELFTTSGHLTYGFIISMGMAAVAMVPVGLLGSRLIYKVIFKTPVYFLVPTIAMATILGTYAVRNSHTDVIIMLVLGTLGFLFKQLGVAPAPIVLGLILGNIAEMGYVQTILGGQASQYPVLKLFENGLSHILIGMILFSVVWPYFSALKRRLSSKGGPS